MTVARTVRGEDATASGARISAIRAGGRRALLATLATALLLAGLLAARSVRGADSSRSEAPPVLARGQEVLGVGTLESVREVPAAFEAAGKIATLLVDEGDTVRAGQLLGTLDPASPHRRLAVSEGGHALARASVARAEADVARARLAKAGAAREFARIDRLTSEGASPASVHDQAEDKLTFADGDLRALEAGLAQARAAEKVARDGVEVSRQQLAETRLLSPMDALVVKRLREPGHFVSLGAPVFTLASTQKLWVRAWVDESALAALRVGQPARIELRSEPGKQYPGRVDRIGRQADRQLHEVLVDVEVLQAPAGYAFGQRADVHISVAPAAAAGARAGMQP